MKAEQQLKESLKALGDLKAALDEHAIVAITDPQGRITYVNDKFCAISRYSREELIGQDHRLINSGHHPREFMRTLWQTVGRGEAWHGEIKNRAKDGSYYWVDTTIVPFLGDEGKPRQYIAIRADITQRKDAEERLRAAAKEVADFKAALDAHAIVAITNPQGRITYVNDKFCAISHYAREELLGQDHRIINSGHHPKEFFQQLWQTIGRGEVWHGEIKNRAKDASFYWVDTTIVPFLGDDGRPRQYIAIRADITERKQAEESMRRSQEQLETVVTNLTEGLVLAELDGRLIHWNRAGLEMHGFTDPDEGKKRIVDFEQIFELSALDGDVLPAAAWPLSRILRGELLRDMEVRVRRKDIEWERVFSYGGATVREPSGRQLAFLTITDITVRHQAAKAIKQLNLELERRVQERTAALESANGELEAFSYSVSHDLRAPLRSIDGFALAVIEDYAPLLPEDGRRYLQTIRAGAQRMGALVDDLLNFSQLGRRTLVKRTVSMEQLVRTVLDELRPQLAGREIDIQLRPLADAAGDAALLKQVWINLLGNAFKYTRKCPRTVVEISAQVLDGNTTYLVRDNGTGFDMQYVDKLFGVFQRLHRMEDYEGTGVGLATVQRIVQRHGGKVWAEAKPEQGATFYFTLDESPAP
jgi:PAS domain S-box-containing protein